MDIGICVEGQNDVEAIKSILTKINSSCINECINYIPRYHRGYPNLLRNLHQTLFEFSRLNISIAVVLADNDRQKKHKRFKELQKICRKSGYDLIALGVAIEAIEAWLLADESALSKLTNRTISALPNPEDIDRPEIILKEITQYRSVGIPYYEVLRKIATELNLDVVRRRCKSFKNFYNAYFGKIRTFLN